MNINQMQQCPGLPQGMGQQPGPPQATQQQMQQIPQQHSQEKLDNISKVKSLIGQLRESLAVTLKNAAHALHQNSQVDIGTVLALKPCCQPCSEYHDADHWSNASIIQQLKLFDPDRKSVDMTPPPRFDKSMEEFYSICDQIELHLKTSIECMNQGASSQRYLPLLVAPTRTEPVPNQDMSTLTYPQYLATVRAQVIYAKEVHDLLLAAASNMTGAD